MCTTSRLLHRVPRRTDAFVRECGRQLLGPSFFWEAGGRGRLAEGARFAPQKWRSVRSLIDDEPIVVGPDDDRTINLRRSGEDVRAQFDAEAWALRDGEEAILRQGKALEQAASRQVGIAVDAGRRRRIFL